MDSTFRPFRTIKPCGDHQVSYKTQLFLIPDVANLILSGDQFLIISGTAQAKLYDRDGFEIKISQSQGSNMQIPQLKTVASSVAKNGKRSEMTIGADNTE
ncbi:5772_t:CDS:2 [Racocetra fulgida]|uniref:5772_t:CDS:1 n=1 Tax=Racocetra fulgida TaxID=60492 RepID=A0A9N9A6J4_9GLOM|nr:5772_t:CDS:2 [Racocetra fulgida]